MTLLTDNATLTQLESEFFAAGFALYELKPVTTLSASIWLQPFPYQQGSILLLGQAGKLFWPAYTASQPTGDDPVDNYSAEVSDQILAKHLPDTQRQKLFPNSECPVNMMALGRELGWHTPSPLGLGIHQQYGLWSAYRAVWWLDTEPDTTTANTQTKPTGNICADCKTQECVRHCPAEAVTHGSMPDITRCADYRYQPDSTCQSACQARLACPVAAEHRYSDEQIAYHYDLKRSMLHYYRST